MVAGARALGRFLPAAARLVADPYGLRFVDELVAAAVTARPRATEVAVRWLAPLRRWVLYMQVRTRVIDDLLCDFVDGGGRQVVLLGAGYDCRAHRFAARLAESVVFEVDHPATQRRKRRILGAQGAGLGLRYLPWNFERQPMPELAAALAALGHRAELPTLTVWEGVTMYLTEDAIDASLAAIRQWSGAGSRLVLTYFDRAMVQAERGIPARLLGGLVAIVGEPWRWGWDPAGLPAWMAARQLAVLRNVSLSEEAARLLPARWAQDVRAADRHLAQMAFERLAVVGR
jgi:methyltransferase (TIGR00027 family)